MRTWWILLLSALSLAHAGLLCVDRVGQIHDCVARDDCLKSCFKFSYGSADRLQAASRWFGGEAIHEETWNGNVTVDWNAPAKRVCIDDRAQVVAPLGMCQSQGAACITIQCRSPCVAPFCMCRSVETESLEKHGRCFDLSLNQLWALAELTLAL